MSFEIGDRVEVISVKGFCDCWVGNRGFITAIGPFPGWGMLAQRCTSCGCVSQSADRIIADVLETEMVQQFRLIQLKKLPPLIDELQETIDETAEMLDQAEKERSHSS